MQRIFILIQKLRYQIIKYFDTNFLKSASILCKKIKMISAQLADTSKQILLDAENYLDSFQQSEENCMFCSDMDVLHCIRVSVMNKHSESDNFDEKLVNKILDGDSSVPVHKKFKDIIQETTGQRLVRFYKKNDYKIQLKNLLDYYKFRRFVPRFTPNNRESNVAQSYYYQRLKLYYNQIKRNLNITVEPSSEITSLSSIDSSQTNPSTKITDLGNNLLESLSMTFKLEQKNTSPTLQNYKTESKALEELLNFMKVHPNIDQIPPINNFYSAKEVKKSSKEIFRDFIEQNKTKSKITNENKNKIFIKFFSKSSSISKLGNPTSPLKILKSENLGKKKQINKNVQIFSKLQMIKNEILQDKVKKIIKIQSKQKSLKSKIQSLKREDLNFKKRKSNQKLIFQNFQQEKKVPLKTQLKPLSKLKDKRSQSETKLKSKNSSNQNKNNLKCLSSKTIKQFLNGQKIQFQKQSKKQKLDKEFDIQRPQSQRKSLDLTKLKKLFDGPNDQKQQNQKKQDYLTQKYQNLVLQTPKRFHKTANITPINSARFKNSENQITLQKNDNIVSMKKKKLEILRKNVQRQKSQRK